MSEQGKHSSPTTEVEAILKTLDVEEQRAYVSVLYSIAKDAIRAQCRELKTMDLEIKHQLEKKSDANFVEWLHSCTIG